MNESDHTVLYITTRPPPCVCVSTCVSCEKWDRVMLACFGEEGRWINSFKLNDSSSLFTCRRDARDLAKRGDAVFFYYSYSYSMSTLRSCPIPTRCYQR